MATIKYLKNGNYFNKVNDSLYQEFSINENTIIEYDNGSVTYDGIAYSLNKVYEKKENGEFLLVDSSAYPYYLSSETFFFMNDDKEVESATFVQYKLGIKNSSINQLIAHFDEECSIIRDKSDLYTTRQECVESYDTIIEYEDGSKEVRKGILNIAKLNKKQQELFNKFTSLIKEMTDSNICFLYDSGKGNFRAFNTEELCITEWNEKEGYPLEYGCICGEKFNIPHTWICDCGIEYSLERK